MWVLADHLQRFDRQCLRLSLLMERATTAQVDPEVRRATQEMCVLALHDRWVEFCRRLVLGCATNAFCDLAGGRYPPVAPSVAAALATLRVRLGPANPNWEPPWHYPHQTIRAAQTLQLPNAPAIAAGIGLTMNHKVEEIVTLRNFLAHRNENTRVQLSVPPRQTPITIALAPAGGGTTFDAWSGGLRVRAKAAIS